MRDGAVDAFLAEAWGRRPWLARDAIEDLVPPSAGELIALAGRDDVRSRVVTAPGRIRHGPFAPSFFADLPGRGWTLLISECDRHHRGCAELLSRFRFLPGWRLDDVMVSLAADGGGIGPHSDAYDVFLVQGRGRRRWRYGDGEESVLDARDLLYLPPRVPHDGVAIGESVTCSVGCRVPDPRELLASFVRELSPGELEPLCYTDEGRSRATRPGELPRDTLAWFERAARGFFDTRFERHLGRFLTRPLRGVPPRGAACRSPAELRAHLTAGGRLVRSAPAHFAWLADPAGLVHVFVGGEHYPLPAGTEGAAELLCGPETLDRAAYDRLAPLHGVILDSLLRGFLSPAP